MKMNIYFLRMAFRRRKVCPRPLRSPSPEAPAPRLPWGGAHRADFRAKPEWSQRLRVFYAPDKTCPRLAVFPLVSNFPLLLPASLVTHLHDREGQACTLAEDIVIISHIPPEWEHLMQTVASHPACGRNTSGIQCEKLQVYTSPCN